MIVFHSKCLTMVFHLYFNGQSDGSIHFLLAIEEQKKHKLPKKQFTPSLMRSVK